MRTQCKYRFGRGAPSARVFLTDICSSLGGALMFLTGILYLVFEESLATTTNGITKDTRNASRFIMGMQVRLSSQSSRNTLDTETNINGRLA